MQQLDKWQQELQRLSDRSYKEMDKELYNYYKDALKKLKAEVKGYIDAFDQLSFSQRLEVERRLSIAARIDEILQEMADDTQHAVKQYVHGEASDGYYGTWYTLEGAENVQLDFSLLPEGYIKELVDKKTAGKTFSKRLYQNRDELAERVTQALLDGAVSGKGYAYVAKQVGELTEANYKQALRIARTEGGRVQSTTKQRAYEEAARKGVELEKVWMSTLDKKTRHSHQELDGQTVAVDADFTAPSGAKGKGPRLFGVAGEDINCRCTTITVVKGIAPKIRKDNETKEAISYQSYNEWAEAKGYKQPAQSEDWKAAIQKKLKPGKKYTLDEVQEIGKLASPEFTSTALQEASESYQAASRAYDRHLSGYEEARKKSPEEYREWYVLYKGLLDYKEEKFVNMFRERTTYIQEKLSELRETGFSVKNFTKYSSVEHKKTLSEVSPLFPKEWMVLSDESPMYIQKIERGFYRKHSDLSRLYWDERMRKGEELPKRAYGSYYDTLAISSSGYSAKKTAIHELGHRMEHLKPEIRRLEHEFYQKRTAGEGLVWLGENYDETELTRVDQFLDSYMGKDYGNTEESSYELLSMGLESLYTGSYNIDDDEDFKAFILGVLITQ